MSPNNEMAAIFEYKILTTKYFIASPVIYSEDFYQSEVRAKTKFYLFLSS